MEQKQTIERKTLAILEKKKNDWQIEVCELPGGTFSIREWGPSGEMGRGVNLSQTGRDALLQFLLSQTGASVPMQTPVEPMRPTQLASNVFSPTQGSNITVNTGAPNTSAILNLLKGV